MNGTVEAGMDAAGRTDAEDIHIFRVAVDDVLYILDVFRVQVRGPGHARFFIDRKDEAQRAVLDILLDEIQRQSDGNAVIGTEAGPIGVEDVAFADQFDFTGQGVEIDAGLGDADHIHMALQNRQRRLFTACRSRLIRNDIEFLILHDGEAQSCQTIPQIIADLFLVTGFTRYLCEFLKLR